MLLSQLSIYKLPQHRHLRQAAGAGSRTYTTNLASYQQSAGQYAARPRLNFDPHHALCKMIAVSPYGRNPSHKTDLSHHAGPVPTRGMRNTWVQVYRRTQIQDAKQPSHTHGNTRSTAKKRSHRHGNPSCARTVADSQLSSSNPDEPYYQDEG